MEKKSYKCRVCKKIIKDYFCDLGHTPLANSFLRNKRSIKSEKKYPLKVYYCKNCYLPQLPEHVKAKNIFSKYDYFSSYSESWIKHSKSFVEKIIKKNILNKNNKICEVASNDGYLLQFFKKKGYEVLGIEPASNVADVAIKKKIPTVKFFFGYKVAKKIKKTYGSQDLIICNNVYAHVPDINDFTLGIKELLSDDGIVTLEFPELLNTIKGGQFDQIYHEHFSYLSLTAVHKIFMRAGLNVFKIEELSTHGGSLRVYGCHKDSKKFNVTQSVINQLKKEEDFGLKDLNTYINFQQKAEKIKDEFITFLLEQKRKNKKVCAYGAAAKGNTLLNYAGIRTDLIDFVCDAAPSKQNKFLPGSHIPILHPSKLEEVDVDFIIIFPWNIADEIITNFKHLKKNGTQFVKAVPHLTIL